jgi:hypothetical protein
MAAEKKRRCPDRLTASASAAFLVILVPGDGVAQ